MLSIFRIFLSLLLISNAWFLSGLPVSEKNQAPKNLSLNDVIYQMNAELAGEATKEIPLDEQIVSLFEENKRLLELYLEIAPASQKKDAFIKLAVDSMNEKAQILSKIGKEEWSLEQSIQYTSMLSEFEKSKWLFHSALDNAPDLLKGIAVYLAWHSEE